MKKTIIAIVLICIIISLAALATFAGFVLMKKGKQEEEKTLEWGEVYLEVLNNEKKLEKMENEQIQLCDLDKDSIPELIIYGLKNAKEYIANIYKINDKNEVDTIKVSLDEEFDLKLLYNSEKDDYSWYAVTEEDKKVYDLNIENEKYKPEQIKKDFSTNFLEIQDNYSEKIDFDMSASKDEKKKMLETAKKEYIKTEDMITEDIKEKIEQFKSNKNISKIDSSKDLVYTAKTFKGTRILLEYPTININSADVKKINEEIKSKYGFETQSTNTETAEIELMEQGFNETEEMSYNYYIYDSILSVVPYIAGNQSIWVNTYNINLKELSEISGEDILKENNLDKKEVIKKSKEVAEKEFDKAMQEDKNNFGTVWKDAIGPDPDKQINEWKENLTKNIEKLEHIYIDESGNIYLLAEYEHLGGQWACTKTLKINITDHYSVEKFEAKTANLEPTRYNNDEN